MPKVVRKRPILKTNTDPDSDRNRKLSNANSVVIRPQDITWVNYGMLSDVNLNTRRGRLILTTYVQYCQDLGGEDYLSMQQKELVRRAATLSMILADLESEIINVDPSESVSGNKKEKGFNGALFGQYMYATKTQAAILKILGLDRRMVDITTQAQLVDADSENPIHQYSKRVKRNKRINKTRQTLA